MHCSGRAKKGTGEGERMQGSGQGVRKIGSGGSGDSPVNVGRGGGGEVNADEAQTAKSLVGWQLKKGEPRLCWQGI